MGTQRGFFILFLLLLALYVSFIAAHDDHYGITTKMSSESTSTQQAISSFRESLSSLTTITTFSITTAEASTTTSAETSSRTKTKTCKVKDTTIIISSEATKRNLCDISCEPLQPTTIYVDLTVTSIDSFVHTVSETITVTVFRGEVETTRIIETSTSKIVFTTTVSNIGSIFTTSFLTELVILTRSFNKITRTYSPAVRTEASRTTLTTTTTRILTSAFTSSLSFRSTTSTTRTIATRTAFETFTTTRIITALDLGTVRSTIYLLTYEYSYLETFFDIFPTVTKYFEANKVTVSAVPTVTITGDSGGNTSFEVFITRYSQPYYSSVLTTFTWSRLYELVANP